MKFCISLLICLFSLSHGTVELCQGNCVAGTKRLVGPTQPTKTRPHPWKTAPFPTHFRGFCDLGCQFFFSENPQIINCSRACNYQYRYHVTVGYSDLAEVAINECVDGCGIALLVCQAGYYCTGGVMLPCPAGRFRGPNMTDVRNVTIEGNATVPKRTVIETKDLVTTCIDCPVGRYRSRALGVTPDDCALCPIGTYLNRTGSVTLLDCVRCPAGMTAEEPGMALCKCITPDSCDLRTTFFGGSQEFYSNGVDFYRESVPYVGRS